MDDETIKIHVRDKMTFEPGLRPEDIIVFVDDGIVTLSGRVRTYLEKYLAEEVAKNVRGVKAVAEEIIVDLHTSLQRSDAAIAEAVVNALAWDVSIVPQGMIKIVVENGNVELTGEVDDYYQKERAAKCIKRLYGIKNIINHTIIKPNTLDVDPREISNQIMREFHRNASIDARNISVLVEGKSVILRGKVRSWAEKKEAKKIAWSAPGVNDVKDELLLSFE